MNKGKILPVLFLALALASPATAQEFQVEDYNVSEYTDEINSHSDQLPGFVKDIVGGEDINVYIDREDKEQYNLSISMDGMDVKNLSTTQLEEPTLEVWTSEEIVQKIVKADEPVTEMKDAINNGDVDYEANKTWTKVKLFFANIFMKIL